MFDGCLVNDAVYDAHKSVFYTVVPLQERDKLDRTKDYQLLEVRLPGLRVVSRKNRTRPS